MTSSTLDSGVVSWALAADEMTFSLRVLTMGAIRKGIEKVTSPFRKALLEAFLAGTTDRCSGRIVPFDGLVADRSGWLVGRGEVQGIKPPAVDSMLAAIAIEHGFTWVTRNVQNFQVAGVATPNPWQA